MSSSTEEYKLTVTTGGATINVGSSSVSTESISSSGAATIGGTLDVTGATTLSSDLSVTGTSSVTGLLNVDNIRIDGNIISTTNTNGNLELAPHGTGEVAIGKANISGGVIDDVAIGGATTITASQITGDNIRLDGNVISSIDSNGNIDITPNGTGEVNISKVDIDGGTIDGTNIGSTTPANITADSLTVDNIDISGNTILSTNSNGDINLTPNGTGAVVIDTIKVDGNTNTISSTDSNGNINLTPHGTGEVNISKVDIDSGAIDNTIIGGSTKAAVSGTNILASTQLGYNSRGTVTQPTSITENFTLNAVSGTITCFTGTYGATSSSTFTVTNSNVAANDVIVLCQKSGDTGLRATVAAVASGSFNVTIENPTSGGITTTFIFNFAIIKSTTS